MRGDGESMGRKGLLRVPAPGIPRSHRFACSRPLRSAKGGLWLAGVEGGGLVGCGLGGLGVGSGFDGGLSPPVAASGDECDALG